MRCPKCGYSPKGRFGIVRLNDLIEHMEGEGLKNPWITLRDKYHNRNHSIDKNPLKAN